MHVHRKHLLWVLCDYSLVVARQVKTKRTVQIMKKRTHATHVAWLRRDPTSAWPIYQDLLLVICAITQRKRGDNECIWQQYSSNERTVALPLVPSEWPYSAVSLRVCLWLVTDVAGGRYSICCFRSADQSTSLKQLAFFYVITVFWTNNFNRGYFFGGVGEIDHTRAQWSLSSFVLLSEPYFCVF